MENRDGLEPGQLVDFETLQKVERKRSQQAKQPKSEGASAPKRRTKKTDED